MKINDTVLVHHPGDPKHGFQGYIIETDPGLDHGGDTVRVQFGDNRIVRYFLLDLEVTHSV